VSTVHDPIGRQVVRIAIASDIHAYIDDGATKSPKPILKVHAEGDGPAVNPVAALRKLIVETGLQADVFLTPGDLGNQANPVGIEYAWQVINQLANEMRASVCVATSGNHDLDSRKKYSQVDPLEVLKKLRPLYPVSDQHEAFRYWTQHFAITETADLRLVSLNSSAFHWFESEWERGRVSLSTLGWLEEELRRRQAKPINILLCHHHPHPHPGLRVADSAFGVMEAGNSLIEVLGSGEHGEWMIIHGHKNHPRISYAAGSSQSPVVFSAGSFSGPIYDELSCIARNQFYLIELPTCSQIGLVGKVRAWTWTIGKGWLASSGQGDGLPAVAAFGCRERPLTLAYQISTALGAAPFAAWEEIVSKLPSIDYLLPEDLRTVEVELAKRYALTIVYGDDGQPAQIGRK